MNALFPPPMSGLDGVLVVLTHYRRPENLPRAIAAWRAQSVAPRRLVVVDNSPTKSKTGEDWGELYPASFLAGADDVWRFRTNQGCSCRFGPAAVEVGHRYVLFADDDFAPAPRALEHLLAWAAALKDEFSTLGGHARDFLLYAAPGARYRGNSCPDRRAAEPVRTDMTCRCHFVRADLLPGALAFRYRALREGSRVVPDPAQLLSLLRTHDDFALSLGIQMASGYPSYAIPNEPSPEFTLFAEKLPEGEVATWKRPEHFPERNTMVELALTLGWTSLRRPAN